LLSGVVRFSLDSKQPSAKNAPSFVMASFPLEGKNFLPVLYFRGIIGSSKSDKDVALRGWTLYCERSEVWHFPLRRKMSHNDRMKYNKNLPIFFDLGNLGSIRTKLPI
jgi:hypothetical protein